MVWDEKQSKKVLRYFFLFNDLLLICSQKRKKFRFFLKNSQPLLILRLRVYVTLRSPNVTVESIDNSSHNAELRIHCRHKSFICYVPNAEDKKYWVKAIRQSIEGTTSNHFFLNNGGTHDEENHTKAIHKDAAQMIQEPATEYSDVESSSEEGNPLTWSDLPLTKRIRTPTASS